MKIIIIGPFDPTKLFLAKSIEIINLHTFKPRNPQNPQIERRP